MSPLAQLQKLYSIKLKSINMRYIRKEASEISELGRCVAVVGAKGVGKSTMILQYLKSSAQIDKTLYISADDILVAKAGLVGIADDFYVEGGRLLAIDEIHQYPGWEIHIKNIIDRYPELWLILSGSSMMSILGSGADLSRRMSVLLCGVLSFREYLELRLGVQLDTIDPKIFEGSTVSVAEAILSKIPELMRHFRDYLDHGAYPFFLESLKAYHDNLNRAIDKSIAEDASMLLGGDNAVILRKILAEVSESSQPYTVNIEKLTALTGTNKPNMYALMDKINDTGLVRAIKSADKHASRKPQKLLFNNSNILAALCKKYGSVMAEGTIREVFFCSHFESAKCLEYADFEANDIKFEIGGKSKTKKQAQREGMCITLVDTDITYEKDMAPLWLVGFVR